MEGGAIVNFLFVRFCRTPFKFDYELNDDTDTVFYGIQSLARTNPGANIFLAHSKRVPLSVAEQEFLDDHEVTAVSFDELSRKIVCKIDPNNEWLRGLNPHEIHDEFYNYNGSNEAWSRQLGNAIKFKALSMAMEAYKLKDLTFLDNDVVTIAPWDDLYGRFTASKWPVVMGQNDFCMNGGVIHMNRQDGPYGFLASEAVWMSAVCMALKTERENKTRAHKYYASDEPTGLFVSRYYGLEFEQLWRDSGWRFVDIASLLSPSIDPATAIKLAGCDKAIAIHCANHRANMKKGDMIRKIRETATAIGAEGEIALADFVKERMSK